MSSNRTDIVIEEQGSQIKQAVVLVRGVPVILASDLAKFFETTTKKVNQYRSRKIDKFTTNYAFQLTKVEMESLRSQNVTSNEGQPHVVGMGGQILRNAHLI